MHDHRHRPGYLPVPVVHAPYYPRNADADNTRFEDTALYHMIYQADVSRRDEKPRWILPTLRLDPKLSNIPANGIMTRRLDTAPFFFYRGAMRTFYALGLLVLGSIIPKVHYTICIWVCAKFERGGARGGRWTEKARLMVVGPSVTSPSSASSNTPERGVSAILPHLVPASKCADEINGFKISQAPRRGYTQRGDSTSHRTSSSLQLSVPDPPNEEEQPRSSSAKAELVGLDERKLRRLRGGLIFMLDARPRRMNFE
ncbi:hypothetical protein F5I97DRAFT_1826431 [Phlebopus sp. FC_14]|nr:hypothetical protein F5I97DRAFT_1826431 [Phlebopus sp. FC_14]